MNRKEMETKLLDEDFEIDESMKWVNFQKYYKKCMIEVKERNLTITKPTEDTVNEQVERKVKRKLTSEEILAQTRAELFPEIVEIMKELKGRSSASHDELRRMFSLYNRFYLRNDSPSCGACVSRIWQTFKKITIGRI